MKIPAIADVDRGWKAFALGMAIIAYVLVQTNVAG